VPKKVPARGTVIDEQVPIDHGVSALWWCVFLQLRRLWPERHVVASHVNGGALNLRGAAAIKIF
jgi:hypothetical protein